MAGDVPRRERIPGQEGVHPDHPVIIGITLLISRITAAVT